MTQEPIVLDKILRIESKAIDLKDLVDLKYKIDTQNRIVRQSIACPHENKIVLTV